MTSLNYLQNGSDIRGIALNGVEGEVPNLTMKEAVELTKGFLMHMVAKTNKSPVTMKFAIGRDPRLSGPGLKNAVYSTLEAYGAEVLDCGLASTPAMFMSTVFEEFDCDGAIMITASHLPFNRNGFKYFDREGGFNKSDISKIIQFAEAVALESASSGCASCSACGGGCGDSGAGGCGDTGAGSCGVPTQVSETDVFGDIHILPVYGEPAPLMARYTKHLRDIIVKETGMDKPFAGMKIVVDAGNGGGGFFASDVLEPLGADVSDSQFLIPNGTFPNHMPNPEDKEAIASLKKQVLETGADFGLIFDTDVDRSSAVDKNGREISRNGIVAMAAALVAESNPGSTIVTDSITSDQLTEFIEGKLGLKHLRFKRGYKNVINKSIELNNNGIESPLAIETSGHAALKENFFLDDGAYLATKICIKAANLAKEGKTLDQLIADLEDPIEAEEVRLPITCEDFGPFGDQLLQDIVLWLKDGQEGLSLVTPNFEGVRINFASGYGDGWCLLRKSLHDPIMPLNIESNTKGGVKVIATKFLELLSEYPALDTTKLVELTQPQN
ncbi:MAG: phosphomannomutase/phosphoglucomutase [Anaerovoracaceae bacterium]